MREAETWISHSLENYQTRSAAASYYNTEAAVASTSKAQYTYGEEIALDQVAFDKLKYGVATLPKSQGIDSKANVAVVQMEDEDSELEEGEVLEEGEISEESSDEEALIAAALIASPFRPRSRLNGSSEVHSKVSGSGSGLGFQGNGQDDRRQIEDSKRGIDNKLRQVYANDIRRNHQETRTYPTTTSGEDEDAKKERLLTEYNRLVDDLYDWGATCDYLIGKGVTKDSAIAVFGRKGYKLPQIHLDRYNETLLQQKDYKASLESQKVPAAGQAVQILPNLASRTNSEDPIATKSPIPPFPSARPRESTQPRPPSPPVMRMGLLLPQQPLPTLLSKKRKHVEELPTPPVAATPVETRGVEAMPVQSELDMLKIELKKKEAEAREALLARKAALAKKAAAVEANTFIESLLASAGPEPSSSRLSQADVSTGPASLPPQIDDRQTPPELPAFENEQEEEKFSITKSAKPVSLIATSLPVTLHTTKMRNRPVATDFESDPTHSLSNVPRWSERLQEIQNARSAYGNMVIDLSDSDEENDDDSEGSDNDELVKKSSSSHRPQLMRQGTSSEALRPVTTSASLPSNGNRQTTYLASRGLSPTVTTSRSASPHLAVNNGVLHTPVSTEVGGRSQELEAKQQEIRRMLDRIKALEGKKRSGSNSSVSSPRIDSRQVAVNTIPPAAEHGGAAAPVSIPILRQESTSDTAMSISESDSS